MISRNKRWQGQTTDSVDLLIRWALHERVAAAAPSPAVWSRVRQAVQRAEDIRHAWNWLGMQLDVVGMYLSGVNSSPPLAGVPVRAWSRPALVRYDLNRIWLDQRHVLRLAC